MKDQFNLIVTPWPRITDVARHLNRCIDIQHMLPGQHNVDYQAYKFLYKMCHSVIASKHCTAVTDIHG